MLKAVPGHTDSAKVTRLKNASAPAFWVENKYCISSLEEATLHVTFQVSLVPLWEHKNLCAFSRNSRTSQVCLALHIEVWGGRDSLTISTFLCKVFINPVKKGRCWTFITWSHSTQARAHRPPEAMRAATPPEEVKMLCDIVKNCSCFMIFMGIKITSQNETENQRDGAACFMCVWRVLSAVRYPMGPDSHWDQVAHCDSTLRTCLSWAVSLTHDLFPTRKYQLPKESWFFMFHLLEGCKTWWWEEKWEICLPRSRKQTCGKSSCRKKERRELCLGLNGLKGEAFPGTTVCMFPPVRVTRTQIFHTWWPSPVSTVWCHQ